MQTQHAGTNDVGGEGETDGQMREILRVHRVAEYRHAHKAAHLRLGCGRKISRCAHLDTNPRGVLRAVVHLSPSRVDRSAGTQFELPDTLPDGF